MATVLDKPVASKSAWPAAPSPGLVKGCPSAMAIPPGRILPRSRRAGTLRPGLPADADQLRLHHHRQDHPRARGEVPPICAQHPDGGGRAPGRARGPEAAHSEVGAVRHRRATPISCTRASSTPTSTNIPRMRLRFSPRPGSTRCSRTSKASPPTGRPIPTPSSASSASTTGRASWNMPNIPTSAPRRSSSALAVKSGLSERPRQHAAVTGSREVKTMLELDDIQHILLTRTPALTGCYEFLSFADGASGRAWLAESCRRCAPRRRSEPARRTGGGSPSPSPGTACKALGSRPGVARQSFPEAFRQGMAARAEVLGDTGASSPSHWVDGTAGPDLHAIAILFARDFGRAAALRERASRAAGALSGRPAPLQPPARRDSALRSCP